MGQREAQRAIAQDQQRKLLKLAEDIVAFGLNLAELPIVMQQKDDLHRYIVLEGNRRLVALRALENPEWMIGAFNAALFTRMRDLSRAYLQNPIESTLCLVVKDRDEARHSIELRHSGSQLEGAGIVPWGADESARFRARSGGLRLHSQVLDFGYWRRIGEHPKLTGLERTASAEVLLRVGVLTGIIGGKNQIPDAQEKAKDLLTESHAIFEAQRNRKKIAETQTELALCYWRTGEIREAQDLLSEALSRLTIDSDLKAKAIIRVGIVEHSAGHDSEAVRVLTDHASLFEKLNNHTLKGSYHHTLGNRLENLGDSERRRDYSDRALIEYAAASYHFEQAEHRSYLACVENNLGFLYFRINRCDDAHKHLDRARRIFTASKTGARRRKLMRLALACFCNRAVSQTPSTSHVWLYRIRRKAAGTVS